MFYCSKLLNVALAGIDGTPIISILVGIAYAILLVGFLLGMYEAAIRGGDVRGLATTAIKYVIIAIIIANWKTVFHDVNDGFLSLAQKISDAGGALDMFASWGDQLVQQFRTNPGLTLWDLVTGDLSGAIVTLLLVVAYVVFAIAMVVFSFFYAMYGAVLYVCGPPIIALLPVLGARDLAKSYAQNVMIWNTWIVLYAVFGDLITAIHMDRVDQIVGNGFLGWMRGLADAPLLGIVSIVYALTIALIPFIAKKIVSGDVGSTAAAIVGTAIAAVGVAAAGASGLAAGSGAAQTAGASGAGGGGSAAAASSSAAAPSAPTRAMTAGEALQAARSSSSATAPPTNSGSSQGSGRQAGGGGSTSAGAAKNPAFYRPVGTAQSLSYTIGQSIGRALSKQSQSASQQSSEA